jgi:hypothetical protein
VSQHSHVLRVRRSRTEGERLLVEARETARRMEEISRQLLQPDMRHAQRERLSNLLHLQARLISTASRRKSSEWNRLICPVGQLIRDLRLYSGLREPHRRVAVHIVGTFPLPWGFLDRAGVMQESLWMLFREALRRTYSGMVTVSFRYDPAQERLFVSLVDTRGAVAAHRAMRQFVRARQEAVLNGRGGHHVGRLARLIKRTLLDGGEIRWGIEPLGTFSTEVSYALPRVGPYLRAESDVGSLPREVAGLPDARYAGVAIIAERSPLTARSLNHALEAHGISAYEIPTTQNLIELARQLEPQSVWIDLEDPYLKDPGVAISLQELRRRTKIVALYAHRRSPHAAVPFPWWDAKLAKPISLSKVRTVLSAVCGDAQPTDEQRLISDYKRDLGPLLEQLDGALAQRDFSRAAGIAHTLKAATIFGLAEVGAGARLLEQALGAGDEAGIRRARAGLGRSIAQEGSRPPVASSG